MGEGVKVKFGKKLKILIPADFIEDVKLSMLRYNLFIRKSIKDIRNTIDLRQ